MKRTLCALLGWGILGVLVVACATRNNSQSASGTFRSPIESSQSPISTPTPPGQPKPAGQTATPSQMASKAAVAARARQQTPGPQPTLRPIRNSQDVIDTVLADRNFQANLNDPLFGAHSKGATPGEPIFVRSIAPDQWDYYLVPFQKEGLVSGVAVVSVKEGKGDGVGLWRNASGERFPAVSASEAKLLVEAKGYSIAGEPQLVFRWLLEGGDETAPFWEVKTTQGITFYVIHILNATKVYRADEVHVID